MPIRSRPAASTLAAPYQSEVLGGYTTRSFLQRHKRMAFVLFAVFAFVYGFAYSLFGTILFLQLAIPFVILAALFIWLLPDTGRAPVKLLNTLLIAFLIALLCWPDYLALALPGLPWITAIRLIGVPLAITMLVCVSVSADFRRTMKDVLGAAPIIWKLLVIFSGIALFSIAVSKDPVHSINKFIVSQLYWVLIFFVSSYVFIRNGRAQFFGYLIWATALFVCLIGVQEARHSVLPWAGHIPSFLKIEDEAVQRILSGSSRAATKIYRVQSKFTTSLGLAEFLAYAVPFILHFMMTARTWAVRLIAFATIPFIFYTILKTDSRLGMVGFFLALLIYLAFWAILRRKAHKNSIFGTAIVVSYPAIFCAFIVATFFVGRLRNIIWGTGAHQFSNESRKTQILSGMPHILSNPWGHGIGQGASTLGFTNGAGTLTIDTYYLVVALEFGVVGFFVYYALFLAAIWKAGSKITSATSQDTLFLLPLTIALTNFVVIKSIFSQQENHPLIFAMLGATVALLYRVKKEIASR